MESEQKFLQALKIGSAHAFEQLYKSHYRMIDHLVAKLGGKAEDAEDIFQETLFVLVKKLRQPDFELTGKVSTLMYAIARNLYLKSRKKGGAELSIEDNKLIQLSQGEEEVVSAEDKELMIGILLDNLNALEEDCRTVLRFSFFKKLSHSEIAAQTGYSESFVKVKKFRCLEYLRRLVRKSPFFKHGKNQ